MSADVFGTKTMQNNKSCAVADKQRQREKSKKSDATSPTAVPELMIVTAAIDAEKFRDVAVIDAPGELLTADMEEEVIFIIENKMVNAMLEIDHNKKWDICYIRKK